MVSKALFQGIGHWPFAAGLALFFRTTERSALGKETALSLSIPTIMS